MLRAVLAAIALAAPRLPLRAQAPAAPPSEARARSQAGAVVQALRTNAAIRLDGVPDEAVWLEADSITEFTQREPREGQPATERTVARILTAPDGLYFAFWCAETHPGRIVHAQLRRDADLDGDDWVGVVLDPQRDRRTGFAFQVNANGAMADFEILNFENANQDWDGVWDARARIGPAGWTAELFIPWQTLRYRRDGGDWGLNVGRFVRHSREETLWRAWRRQQGPYYLEDEGILAGLEALPPRGLTEWRPYASARAQDVQREYAADGSFVVDGDRELEGKAGLDGKIALAPTLTLDLTANTDFAQVDADQQLVNLTRFPLFFPEKRPFFLEASGLFTFGQSERAMAFYSRRIGLGAGRDPVPIVAGARLTGRVGAERVGLLAARTGLGEEAFDVVARLKHDVLSRGYLGGILTGQGGPGVRGTRLTSGADFELPFVIRGQNLVVAGHAMGTRDSGGAPTRSAGRLFVDFPNDWSDDFLSVSWIEAGFDPALGFVRQSGVWRHTGRFEWNPRPRLPGVRQLSFTLIEWDVSTTIGGGLSNATYSVTPLGIEFHSGDELDVELSREVDVPDAAFDVWERETPAGTETVTIPAGRYAWNRAVVRFESSWGRPVGVEADVSVGQFYGGMATGAEIGVDLRVAPHLIAGWGTEVEWVRLPQGRFAAQTMQARLDYAFSPRLATLLWMQWDNESQRASLNARLHWIPRPGSDAYLVWDSAWPTGLERLGQPWRGIPWRRPTRGALVGKVVWYFRP